MTRRERVVDWTFRAVDVTKVFGELKANDGITLEVRPGEVYGLLGPKARGGSCHLIRRRTETCIPGPLAG